MFPIKNPDFPRVPISSLEELHSFPAAVLTTCPEDESTLALVAMHKGASLILPEYWSMHFPECGVLISSAISGGDLSQRFQEAAACFPGRCWLHLEPVHAVFSLPCPTGAGAPMAEAPTGPSFFSQALCCQYAHFLQGNQGRAALWDTEETLEKKLQLARQAGFLGYACEI